MTPSKGGDVASLPRRALREPLVVFALIGAALFLLFELRQDRTAQHIVLSADTRRQLVTEFETLTGRRADAGDVARLERSFITDTILFREGLARGIHLSDGEIRRAVITRMRREVVGPAPSPTPEALVNFYAEHIDRYYTEPSISFRHVFFLNPPDAPRDVLERLQAGENVQGDRYWQGNDFPDYGESVVRALFGQSFLAALREAPRGEWIGPVRSPRGHHFVRVAERQAAHLIPFEAARSQVTQDWLVARMEERVAAWMAERKDEYVVDIER